MNHQKIIKKMNYSQYLVLYNTYLEAITTLISIIQASTSTQF